MGVFLLPHLIQLKPGPVYSHCQIRSESQMLSSRGRAPICASEPTIFLLHLLTFYSLFYLSLALTLFPSVPGSVSPMFVRLPCGGIGVSSIVHSINNQSNWVCETCVPGITGQCLSCWFTQWTLCCNRLLIWSIPNWCCSMTLTLVSASSNSAVISLIHLPSLSAPLCK